MQEPTNKRFYAKVVEIPQPPCEMWDCLLQDHCREKHLACDAYRYYVLAEESKFKKTLDFCESRMCDNLKTLT